MQYVFLGDSPTLESGFSRVTQNIVPNLNLENKFFWGIGYDCELHKYDFPIYPANINSSWESVENAQRFKKFLLSLGSTITLWTIHDPFRFANYIDVIKEVRKEKLLKLICYVPVDCYFNKQSDVDFLREADGIVAYTQFGKENIKKQLQDETKPIYVIPHGSDSFFKKTKENKKFKWFPEHMENKILGVVNSNSKRKNLYRTIDIFSNLIKLDDSWRLYLHSDPNGYFNLKQIALEMGVLDKCIFADPFFQTGIIGDTDCPKEALVEIYNCFDLFLSTSHGEGWGLTATEAASCEVPIALGNHSSFSEIFDEKSAIFLEDSQSVLYMGKSVPDFDAKKSAEKIYREFPNSKSRVKKAKEIVKSFDWEEINKKWQILIE